MCIFDNINIYLFQIIMLEEKNVEFCKQCQEKGLQNKILKFSTIQNKNTSLFFCSSRKVKLRK